MKDEIFQKIVRVITIIGSLSVIALTIWTMYLYSHCSIIQFIANGG